MHNAILIGLLSLLSLCTAQAADYPLGNLQVLAPQSRETAPVAPTAVVYFTLRNTGPQPDRLLGVDTPLAGRAQLHGMASHDGLMDMQPVTSVALPANSDTRFANRGYHVMLLDLTGHPRDGQQFPLNLHFEKAGDVQVQVEVHRDLPEDSQ